MNAPSRRKVWCATAALVILSTATASAPAAATPAAPRQTPQTVATAVTAPPRVTPPPGPPVLGAHPRRIPAVRTPHPRRPLAVVEIVTVPRLAKAVFVLDGKTLVADARGVVRVSVPAGSRLHRLEVVTKASESNGARMTFSRWGVRGDQQERFKPVLTGLAIHHNMRIQAAYRVSYLVAYQLFDESGAPVKRSRATRVTLRSELGDVTVSSQGDKVRLPGIRPVSQNGIVAATELVYSVESVLIDGSNVVHAGSQRFRPAQAQQVDIPVLLRTAHFTAHDLLFGRPVGNSLEVVYPDGKKRRVTLSARGELTLEKLARGTYQVRVETGGISFLRPVALSRNQYVDLPVISYLDLGILGGTALAAAGLLLLLGFRRKRRLSASARELP